MRGHFDVTEKIRPGEKNALAVRKDLGVHAIGELPGKVKSIGSDYEFFGRPECAETSSRCLLA